MLRLSTLTWGLIAIFCTTIAHAEEFVRPFEKAAEEYYDKLRHRRFEDLEQDANIARNNNTKISDGQPRLASIYGGIAGCLTVGCNNLLSEPEWQQRLQLISEWKEKNSRSVTAAVAYASYFLEHAYAIRGQGYANTVPKEAWVPFRESIETARKELQALPPHAKTDPGYYSAMLDVGVAQAWPLDKFESLYQEASQKHPAYLPIYFSASSYFSPRWHGTSKNLRVFIEEAVNKTKADLGETLYTRLNWSLWTSDMFVNGQASWTRMKAGFEEIISNYPDPWNINNYAKFACLARDGESVLRLAKRIGQKPISQAWWGSNDYYRQCVAASQAHVNKRQEGEAANKALRDN